jgi:predicted regulator of Ras-like GTPase activity (Roadblock/LC7/MglB family)
MDARYNLLLHKQFDLQLTERETYELQGYLAGNESAAKLCENIKKLIDECEKMEPPEHLKPTDAEFLLQEILSALTKTQSRSWFSFVKQFVKDKTEKQQTNFAHKDELEVLRSKHKTSSDSHSKAMDSIRAKVLAEVAPVAQPDAVSLAEAIKRRMLQVQFDTEQSKSNVPNLENNLIYQTAEVITMAPPIFNNSPPSLRFGKHPQSISESMDQLFSSANWPVYSEKDAAVSEATATHHQDNSLGQQSSTNLEIETPIETPQLAITQFDFRLPQPLEQQQQQQQQRQLGSHPKSRDFEIPQFEVPRFAPPQTEMPQSASQQHQSALSQNEIRQSALLQNEVPQSASPQHFNAHRAPEILKPASLIPVDEIIAHVSHMFAEHIHSEPREVIGQQALRQHGDLTGAPDDPLRSSGGYPQIRDIDLRQANSARLGTAHDTIEPQGLIKSLGKFLLDKTSESAIGALNSTNVNLSHARILSDEEAMALQECLTPIENLPGVAGCIILGYDGMIITSTLPEHADKDTLSAWALLTYMNTHELIRLVGHTRLRQFVSRTLNGYLLLADFGQGLLLAVSDNASTEAILPLMKSVRRITAA